MQTKDEEIVEPDEDSDYSDDEEQHQVRPFRLMKGKIDPWVEPKVEMEVQQVTAQRNHRQHSQRRSKKR